MFFFFSSRRRHTRWPRDWSSDVCSSDLDPRTDVAGRDEPLADEDRVGPGRDDTPDLGSVDEAALAHDDRPRRYPRQELERRLDPRLERAEVAVVDKIGRASCRGRGEELG